MDQMRIFYPHNQRTLQLSLSSWLACWIWLLDQELRDLATLTSLLWAKLGGMRIDPNT
jgi:hypothetical protein